MIVRHRVRRHQGRGPGDQAGRSRFPPEAVRHGRGRPCGRDRARKPLPATAIWPSTAAGIADATTSEQIVGDCDAMRDDPGSGPSDRPLGCDERADPRGRAERARNSSHGPSTSRAARKAPFMELNCSALRRTFSRTSCSATRRGAFTGATHLKRGLVELSDGGTLFLDEIGDMPASTQAKLLRFIEHRTFKRVGGSVGHLGRHPDRCSDQRGSRAGREGGEVPRRSLLATAGRSRGDPAAAGSGR